MCMYTNKQSDLFIITSVAGQLEVLLMNGELWANYSDALKLILSGSISGRLNPEQKTIYKNMLSHGMTHGKYSGPFKPERNLSNIQTTQYCIDEENQKFETRFYIPDIFRLMVEVNGKSSLQTLPVNHNYLNSLSDGSGEVIFCSGEGSDYFEWLDSPGGKKYWNLLCRKNEIKRELAELETMHHDGKPSEKESLQRQKTELLVEKNTVEKKISRINRQDVIGSKVTVPVNDSYIPYFKVLRKFQDKYDVSPEELAAWIYAGPECGGLNAYINANELDPPPRFEFDVFSDDDYLDQIVTSWFSLDEVENYIPEERYITGQILINRWQKHFGKQVISFIRAKIAESRLLDFNPITGTTAWTGDDSYPPMETALFTLSHVQDIEIIDGISSELVNNEPKVGTPEWRKQNAKKAADARHDKAGGSRDKQKQIQNIWAAGKYTSKDRCAEEECGALDMSFSAARNALKNQPEPD